MSKIEKLLEKRNATKMQFDAKIIGINDIERIEKLLEKRNATKMQFDAKIIGINNNEINDCVSYCSDCYCVCICTGVN
jgi:hypothetical protein